MSKNRWKRVAALIPALGIPALSGCGRPATKPPETPPPIVLVSQPVKQEVVDYEEFTGRTDAVNSVTVTARVTGYLDKVNFVDGVEVQKDDLLFLIDPRQYKAKLDLATADLASKQSAEARARADLQRNQQLFNKGGLAELDLIHFKTDYDSAHAAIESAQATLDTAKLDMEFTQVTAPIAGRISRRMVDPGNLVQADSTALTTIVSLDPMYVYFDVDERTVLKLRRLVREGKIQSRAQAEIPILVGLVDEVDEYGVGLYPHTGRLNFSDNRVDNMTGTLRLRAILENPAPSTGNLRVFTPGLFVRVRLRVGVPHQSILVTEKAMGTDQGKKFVYVVENVKPVEKDGKPTGAMSGTVSYRSVTVGALNKGMRVVESGLKEGERVIVSGLQRVKPKSTVIVRPESPTLRADATPVAPGSAPGAAEKKEPGPRG